MNEAQGISKDEERRKGPQQLEKITFIHSFAKGGTP